MRSRKQAAAIFGTSSGRLAGGMSCTPPGFGDSGGGADLHCSERPTFEAFYRARHREGSGHDSAQTPQNGIAADDDDDRSDDGIMGDNRAPHAAGRAEQMLAGRIPAHGSRKGPGGCNIWTRLISNGGRA